MHCSFLIKCTTVQWWIYIIMLKCTYLNVRKLLISKCWYFGVQYFLKSSAPQWWMQIIFMFKCYFKSEKINKNPPLPPSSFCCCFSLLFLFKVYWPLRGRCWYTSKKVNAWDMGAYMVRDATILAIIDPTLQLVTQTSDVK